MLSRSEASKTNERGAHVGNKTVQSEAAVLLPVLPGNGAVPCQKTAVL